MKLMTTLPFVIKSHAALDSVLQFLDAEDVCYSEGCPTAGQILQLHAMHKQHLQLLDWVTATRSRKNEETDGQTEIPISWPCTLRAAEVRPVQDKLH